MSWLLEVRLCANKYFNNISQKFEEMFIASSRRLNVYMFKLQTFSNV